MSFKLDFVLNQLVNHTAQKLEVSVCYEAHGFKLLRLRPHERRRLKGRVMSVEVYEPRDQG